MPSFDTLFRGKKQYAPSQKGIIRAENDQKKTLHKDIEKRVQTISLKSPRKNKSPSHPPRTPGQHIEHITASMRRFFHGFGHEHVFVLVVLIFLSFLIYGVGFVIRTESTLARIREAPEQIMSLDTAGDILSDLWRDYQILGLVADNSPIPIEPLTSYGILLRNARALSGDSDRLTSLAGEMQGWAHVSESASLTPILEHTMSLLRDFLPRLRAIISSSEILLSESPHVARLRTIYHSLANIPKHEPLWKRLIGVGVPSRILILNQNNDELRAGGGFPGTVFIIEMNDGKLTNMTFHDIYELDWKLTGYRTPPPGIDTFRSVMYPGRPVEFEMRDANYFPTFAESAATTSRLADMAGIGGFDLVIGINTSLLRDILTVTGPISVPEVPTPLTAENATLILSLLVESKQKIGEHHKTIVQLLGDQIVQRLQRSGDGSLVAQILLKQLMNGEIMIASPKSDLQGAIDDLHLVDTWMTSDEDFVYPIFTSIGRNKTDRVMNRSIIIEQLSSCVRSVTLSQTHTGGTASDVEIKQMAHTLGIPPSETLMQMLSRGPNVQYLRFVLPRGARMESTDPTVKIRPTSSPYVLIDTYTTTRAGDTTTTRFEYTVPDKLCGKSPRFIKQPGLTISSTLLP